MNNLTAKEWTKIHDIIKSKGIEPVDAGHIVAIVEDRISELLKTGGKNMEA